MQTYKWGNHEEGRKNNESPWYCEAVCILRQNISNWELRVTSIPNPISFVVCTSTVPLDRNFCHQQPVLTSPLSHKGAWELKFKHSLSTSNQENWKPSEVNGVTCFIAFSSLWSRHKWAVLISARSMFLKLFLRAKHLLAPLPSSDPWAGSSNAVCVSQGPGWNCLQALTPFVRNKLLLTIAAAKHCATSLPPWILEPPWESSSPLRNTDWDGRLLEKKLVTRRPSFLSFPPSHTCGTSFH